MQQTSQKNVVVVDDCEHIREHIKELVDSVSTCTVSADACNGEEAVQLITSTKPNIVILDINMPKKSGIEVLKEIKHFIKDIYIIVISNYPESAYKNKCLELGANYYLDKTKDFEKLKSTLTEISLAS